MDEHDHACCAPGRAPSGVEAVAPESANDAATDGMVRLGGSFLMGTEDADGFPQDREGPIREIDLPPGGGLNGSEQRGQPAIGELAAEA